MKYSFYSIIFFAFLFGIFSFKNTDSQVIVIKERLSEYNFFIENIADQKPTSGIIPYQLNTPLFSDYAEKLRFVKIPKDSIVNYNATEVLEFPVGTTIIKTFYYPIDFRKPDKGRKLMETRLLIHEKTGWKALEYVWNEEQTDAFLEVAGETKEVSYIFTDGKKRSHQYSIPNLNQCKGCHNRSEKMMPIGPSARQLNGDFNYNEKPENQLAYWQKLGVLKNMPAIEDCPKAPIWNKPETGSLNSRARIYLDINCAHCHNPKGPAMTSGLNLSVHETNPTSIGINKSPVAAGRGSGGLDFDIVKGQPEKSILYYRMQSNDPGIRMPEVGRTLVHTEGVGLVRDWIKALK